MSSLKFRQYSVEQNIMISFLKKCLYVNIITVFLITSAYADIPIHVMSNTNLLGSSAQLSNGTIQSITKQALSHAHINIANHSPYAFIQVKLIKTTSSRYLLAHLMSRYYFSYQIIRINLTANNAIQYPVIKNYHLQTADFFAQSNNIVGVTPQCPAQYQTGKPLFVIGTPYYTEFKSVSLSVDALSQAVLKTNQYQLVKLIGNDATIQNYQNILACPTLKYFFHIGHSDEDARAFVLSDGDFDATYFSQNPQLNLRDKVISLDSCELFDQVDQGFCPILSKIKNPPLAYTSGSSELLIYGSPETYACFWKKVLAGAPMTQSTLAQCAIAYDPSVRNSQSGTYLLGADDPGTPVIIKTNQRTITIQPADYTVLKLHNGEMVTQYIMQKSGKPMNCTPDPTNRVTLLNNPTLTAGEFELNAEDSNSCEFSEMSRIERDGNLTRDIYGFHPAQSCFKLPDVPPVGDLTLSSKAGNVDMNCNGAPSMGPFNSNAYYSDWQSLSSEYQSNNLDCTFNLDSTKAEIASLHLNIRPSTTLPGEFSGQISNVKNMNGYSLPSITYSGKGDAQGYHNGVEIMIN